MSTFIMTRNKKEEDWKEEAGKEEERISTCVINHV